ncbi:putative uncharacterized protein DDB_G0282133 isoform X1 [Vespa crabro]|uniref:putative uncharacterized protein DDB_G0282133 isoform X1 n=1 Tax=Vespa crabro TaxID=7445 RepID=UPI001F0037EE|nr:putative uncharacterized protein DDB_G0282133 isoform X1 [Vespa crabro]XP_046815079.1 putative uncharacterized protein DDB_G0282133 isoform X1 [Vespa crabro]
MEISPRKSSKRTQEHVDEWLQSQGYFRKHIPRDPTCLFRAVSEQVYLTQYYHIRVRKECVEFMRQKKHLFEESITIPFDNYLEQMACFTESGGPNEIQAISLLYKKDIILFNGQKQTCKSVTNNGFTNHIYLCHTPQKQYESVYNKNFVMAAGFCQSIMYQILYKNVFDMKNVDNTVHKMLHDRSSTLRHDKFFLKGNLEIREQLSAEIYKRIENGCETTGDMYCFSKGVPPFPYRVAKAIDVNIYRNIDFDVWHEIRREIKNAGWTRYNSNGLQIGDKCLIEMNFNKNDLDGINNNTRATSEDNQGCNETKTLQKKSDQNPTIFCGHIQEISKNEGSVVVFVEELGEKKTVPYSSLKPLSLRKNKQSNWAPTCKKNVQLIDSNQKYKKSSNASSNKTKEQINRMDSTSTNNPEKNLDNNKCSITTSNTCISDTTNVTTPLLTTSTAAPVMIITNNNDNNNENIKREDFSECQWQRQECRNNQNQGQVLGENTLGKLQNYTTNNNTFQFHGQGDMDENTTKDSREDNSQVVTGTSSLYYVASDGNSYPAVSYVPGYTGELIPSNQMNRTLRNVNNLTQKGMDLNSCDLPLSDPATLKFFYNLGLEYFRVNHAWNYGPNGQSAPPESWCIAVPSVASSNTNASQNMEEVQNINTCIPENEKPIEQKENTDNNANNTIIPQLAQKTMNMCVNNVTDLQKDKLKKMENGRNTSQFAQENIKDTENVNKDKQRANNTAPRFKKNTPKDQHYNNCEQMYPYKKNFSKQYQQNPSFCESQNVPNLQNGDMQAPLVNTVLNQVHVPPGMPNSCHIPYMQQSPYPNIPYCENEIDTYGGSYYLSQGGFPNITCIPNSDVVDANNMHSFLPYFYPSAETYPPAYPSVYSPYMHPQQTAAYGGLPPQNIHDSWYSVPEQHYYLQYGPVPVRTAEPSGEIGQSNNSNSST